MKKRIVQIIIHIAVWLCFFSLPYFIYPQQSSSLIFPSNRIMYFVLLSNTFLVLFYYSNSSVFIPKLLARRKTILYILAIVCCYLLFCLIQYNLHRSIELIIHHPRKKGWFFFFSGASAIFFLIYIVSSGIKIISEWFRAEQKKEQVENEKLQTELSLLKAQINPHFMFNVLNTIYSLALSQSEKTPDAVMKLSKLMRYVMNDSAGEMVMLESEIQYISNYIDLQKMRLTDMVTINYHIALADIMDKRIAPMLLIPFVENAFKYGVSTREYSPIDISLGMEGKWMVFEVKNRKINTKNSDSNNIGIDNVKRRLELIYPNNYELEIEDFKETYQVSLKIALK